MNGYQGKTTTTKQANKKPLKFLKATFFSQLQNLSAETHISLGKGTANSHSFSSSCFLMILYLTLGEPLDWVSLFSLRWKYGNQSRIFFYINFYFMFMTFFLACMSENHVHAWCPQRTEEVAGFSETGAADSYESLWGCWEWGCLVLWKNSQWFSPLSLSSPK